MIPALLAGRPVMSGQGGITAPSLQESTVPTRRIMEVTIITIVLWDLGKGAIRLWTRKTWNATTQGSVAHTAAELTSIFV